MSVTNFCESGGEGKNLALQQPYSLIHSFIHYTLSRCVAADILWQPSILFNGAIHCRFGIRHTRRAAQCVLLLEAPSAGMLTPHRIDCR